MKPIASPKGPSSRILAAIFAALLCASVSACLSEEEGTTPDCGSAESCNPFATCVVNGKVAPAAECCKNLEGFELDACLYGYGAAPDPGGSMGGGGG